MRSHVLFPALGLLIVALALAGCSADDPAATAIQANQNPLTYVALGNSLTAGFINGGLIQGGQDGSYPRLISAQAMWSDVTQPTVLWPGIGSTPGRSALYVDNEGAITSKAVTPEDAALLLANATHPVPYSNMGVPGATTADLLVATNYLTSQSGTNPFFDMILRNHALRPGGNTQFDQAKALNPKAVTLWIGANDVLGGATGGNPVFGTNVTPAEFWEGLCDDVLDSVATIGADYVAVATIPSITSAAYFTTVSLEYEIEGVGSIPWQTDEDDVTHILLTYGTLLDDTYLPAPYGTGTASIPSTGTLTSAEAAAVEATIDAYNDHIESEAAARGWALADVAQALDDIGAGTAELNLFFGWGPTGQNKTSAFSLDGIHPSEKGYAKVANVFIEAFNGNYDLEIPTVDLASIHNTTGFDESPGYVPPHGKLSAGPLFSESGLRAMEGLPAMLGSGQ